MLQRGDDAQVPFLHIHSSPLPMPLPRRPGGHEGVGRDREACKGPAGVS